MKLLRLASMAQLVAVLAGCDASTDESAAAESAASTVTTVQATPESTSTTPAQTTTQPRTTNTQPQRVTPEFSNEMVRARGTTKQNKGGQSNVRFVAGSTDTRQVEQLALACVAEFVKQTKAAFCYAYGTQADYDLTTPDWTPEFDESAYGASRPCWVAYAGQALADSSPSVGLSPDPVAYEVSGCPGGMQFPS